MAAAVSRSARLASPPGGRSSCRVWRARLSARARRSVSVATAPIRRAAQARLTTRRARISGPQAKGDQRAKASAQANVRRNASRAPRSPWAISAGSQAKACSSTAKGRDGLGRFHGSADPSTSMAAPASMKRPASTLRPGAGSCGRKSRGVAAKALTLRPFSVSP